MRRIVFAKHCGDCGELKPLTAFQRDADGVMERKEDCRICCAMQRYENTTEALDPERDLVWGSYPQD